jgi:hypothetical protein
MSLTDLSQVLAALFGFGMLILKIVEVVRKN